jgi:hypothetical protein
VESLDNHLALRLVVITRARVVLMKEALEIRVVHKDLGANEVEEREELLQAVLQRRARDEQAPAARERAHDLREDAVRVLDAVRLVNDDVLERELLERALLDQAELVRGHDDLERLREQPLRDDLRTFLLRALQDDDVDVRCPVLELALPVLQCALGDDDDVRAGDASVVLEVGEEGDRLERLAEALRRSVSTLA